MPQFSMHYFLWSEGSNNAFLVYLVLNKGSQFSFIQQDRRGARMGHLGSGQSWIYNLDLRLNAKSLPGPRLGLLGIK